MMMLKKEVIFLDDCVETNNMETIYKWGVERDKKRTKTDKENKFGDIRISVCV